MGGGTVVTLATGGRSWSWAWDLWPCRLFTRRGDNRSTEVSDGAVNTGPRANHIQRVRERSDSERTHERGAWTVHTGRPPHRRRNTWTSARSRVRMAPGCRARDMGRHQGGGGHGTARGRVGSRHRGEPRPSDRGLHVRRGPGPRAEHRRVAGGSFGLGGPRLSPRSGAPGWSSHALGLDLIVLKQRVSRA